ncbi:NAD(P)-dependent oxidoreductase [Leucobacter sp. PH1c]|uniref:NAD(P)-dependent oxidoreductase n=1 Tax=Leucobacter sp. PH1c TaxID=1397278 RepID=UPI0004A7B9EC|nr:NAD(P)-dependent oxidoreductase [Leucobacter sp. PH1c]
MPNSSAPEPRRIGFIGLGAMGAPMAHRLVDAGYDVTVWNRSPERTRPLTDRGAKLASSPAELAAKNDLVLSCLLDTAVIREVHTGPDGTFSGSRPGQVIVEHGTFSPEAARELSAAAEARGLSFVDAPVSGGAVAAAAGALVVMAGGPSAAEASLRAVASAYAAVVEWLGPAGSGLALKLINQMLVSTHVAAASEAARLIQELGIEGGAATRALTGGWAGSAMLARCLPLALDASGAALQEPSDATIGGLAEAQQLVHGIGTMRNVGLPVFAAAAARFTEARARGWGSRDLAALVELERATRG